MRLLLFLADHPGEVVSIDDVLSNVWPDVAVTPDSVYQSIASLRRLLGDNPKQPTYIATVPRLGYRLVATVSPWSDQPVEPTNSSPGPSRLRSSEVFDLKPTSVGSRDPVQSRSCRAYRSC
jgi:transcriptional activator of cad operon